MSAAPSGSAADDGGPVRVIGVGASAGGVEALTGLVRELPVGFSGALLVVLHVSPAGTSVLAHILDRAGPLPAVAAADGQPLEPGTVYVAPPDRHLLVQDGCLRLSAGPRENGHRPAIDPTFRSLAAYDGRAVGVILSGTRDDGTVGLAGIKEAGGTALVQDPEEAAYPGMIDSALRHVAVDGVLTVAGLAQRLVELTQTNNDMTNDPASRSAGEDPVSPTRYTCPECGGHISRQQNGSLTQFVCEVGHAYSPESMEEDQGMAVEAALWTATRMLGDRTALLTEMAERADRNGHASSASGFREAADSARRAGQTIRRLIEAGGAPTSSAEPAQ